MRPRASRKVRLMSRSVKRRVVAEDLHPARLRGQGDPFAQGRAGPVLRFPMFARKIRVEYEENGRKLPCPLKWLDSFSMRNFTNASVFDDTLPLGDGLMEIGTSVPLEELKDAMEDWFRRKSYLPKGAALVLTEE